MLTPLKPLPPGTPCKVDGKLDACDGELDDYCCTDGSLIRLCKRHLPACPFVVHDGPDVPMTRRYYDEVYAPRLKRELEKSGFSFEKSI